MNTIGLLLLGVFFLMVGPLFWRMNYPPNCKIERWSRHHLISLLACGFPAILICVVGAMFFYSALTKIFY